MNPPQFSQTAYDRSLTATMSAVMKQVYLLMTFGLAITGILSWALAQSPAYVGYLVQHPWAMWVLCGVELLIVIVFSVRIQKMSALGAIAVFLVFSAVNGMALTPIFLIYTGATLAKAFFCAAGMFAAMSIYGYCTNRDLSRMGPLLFMGLIGLIIMMLVNAFTHSAAFEYVICLIGVVLFVGLTAWDTQQIKAMALQSGASDGRIAAWGALSLYLDFINLFLMLLRLFGRND